MPSLSARAATFTLTGLLALLGPLGLMAAPAATAHTTATATAVAQPGECGHQRRDWIGQGDAQYFGILYAEDGGGSYTAQIAFRGDLVNLVIDGRDEGWRPYRGPSPNDPAIRWGQLGGIRTLDAPKCADELSQVIAAELSVQLGADYLRGQIERDAG
ncbi:hypothetical protein [Spongiactinospora sp. 9N601]|uniref:hypothetical protein n=1 Tax=Spongiactinospora sp. 9N601 TaxID=3375149 RepID=UPI0037AD68AE